MGSLALCTISCISTRAEWATDDGEVNVDDILIQRAAAYEREKEITLGEQLGCGIHGIVRVAEHKVLLGRFAVKIHRNREAYLREKTVYRRLRDRGIVMVRGFNVPQLLGWSDAWRAIEMTIVTRPFVLDFAGAWMDKPPTFPPEVWGDWETEKLDQFGDRWKEVKHVLAVLQSHGIFLLDVSPANVAFSS